MAPTGSLSLSGTRNVATKLLMEAGELKIAVDNASISCVAERHWSLGKCP